MSQKILVAVAWPYANGSLHLGQIAGAYLPADIFARYQRAAGNDVLMVSGSDAHGTPVTVRAEAEGIATEELAARYQAEFLQSWQDLGITFDLFTSTHTDNHAEVSQRLFATLMKNGHVYEDEMPLWYCPVDKRFLPDRYVEGTCPHCGYEGARGDQCDNCGRTLNSTDLIDPKCRIDGSTPEIRQSRHLFLRLSAFNKPLGEWLTSKADILRRPVYSWSQGIVNEGLPDRAITRDLDWGIAVPAEGYEDKRIYVWIEAVMGYLSAAIEWARNRGEPERWREWWQNHEARSYYFIGKDNIPFHTLIWPAILMGAGDAYGEPSLQLPYDVPANQYVNFKGAKASTSRGTAPFLPAYLQRFDPDALRYYLAATMPELQDSSFDDADLIRRNNDELVATWGNLVNRVLTFTVRNFEAVPEPGDRSEASLRLVSAGGEMLRVVGAELGLCRFRAGLQAAMAYAGTVNQFLDETAPWKAIKDDREAAGSALWTAIQAIGVLKTALYPFLPFSSQQLHDYLGFQGSVDDLEWSYVEVPAGQKLAAPQPLFKKLDAAELLAEA
ncbi:MAG: methionine--tRNA ligase [Dehalococcoidia bacterium]